MRRAFRHLLAFALSVLVLSAAVFCLCRLAPGDPLRAWYGDRSEKLTTAERAAARQRLGLDEPLPGQYLRWLGGALRGEFGISYQYKQDVRQVIAARAGNTLLLGGVGYLFIFLGALALGMLCARYEGRRLDRLLCQLGTVTSCIPEFWLSLALMLVFCAALRWLPGSGAITPGDGSPADRLRHLILPLAVVVLSHLWYYTIIVRDLLLEQTRAGYVRMARAAGLPRRAVLTRHCLRNILPSYLSLMAIGVPHVLGGTYVVETVFSYPGLGSLAYESARCADYNLLMVLCLLTGILMIGCSQLGQWLGERLDPRLRAAAEAGR